MASKFRYYHRVLLKTRFFARLLLRLRLPIKKNGRSPIKVVGKRRTVSIVRHAWMAENSFAVKNVPSHSTQVAVTRLAMLLIYPTGTKPHNFNFQK